eukprot:gene7737-biopygen18066
MDSKVVCGAATQKIRRGALAQFAGPAALHRRAWSPRPCTARRLLAITEGRSGVEWSAEGLPFRGPPAQARFREAHETGRQTGTPKQGTPVTNRDGRKQVPAAQQTGLGEQIRFIWHRRHRIYWNGPFSPGSHARTGQKRTEVAGVVQIMSPSPPRNLQRSPPGRVNRGRRGWRGPWHSS